ncbi:DUF6624 domain-containing protein [Actinoallomurus rhizosphaericola]|uniref:DUF6624 domain-containing protein n=1 Tax=Actinoallomurus rhizosphaericola TaxID=2952536 RepID=UPI0020922E21|nr:DUF6624 domain-containing protein [Actinoallomurus rhizosphaericola]MCO5999913.1 hypothetical protein [Actinoallomurus rhizosphaericola]
MRDGDTATEEREPRVTPADPALAAELIAMTDEDRRLQGDASAGGAAYEEWAKDVTAQLAYRRVTTRNADRLDEIMDEHGWPTTELVGAEAARRAWLIAQHADRRLDVQRRAVRLMTDAVAIGAADAGMLAMLRDRVLVNEGREQLYGTQVAGVEDGVPILWPCADPDRVNERRAEVGLGPLPGDGEGRRR